MTLSTSVSVAVYNGNGATTNWPVNFAIFDLDHLVVQRQVAATGLIDYTYSYPSEYTVYSLPGAGGSIELGVALSSAYQLVVSRVVPYVQELDILNQGGFFPETLEDQLDKIVMQIQQIGALAARAILFPQGETGPTVVTGFVDGDTLQFNGTEFEPVNISGVAADVANATAAAAAAAVSEGNAATSETNAAASETAAGISETNAADSESAAAASAILAALSASVSFIGTSSTGVNLDTVSGSTNFTLDADAAFAPNQPVVISSDADPTTDYMVGSIISYDSGTDILEVNVTNAYGSSNHTDWTIGLLPDSAALLKSGGTMTGSLELASGTLAAMHFQSNITGPASPVNGDMWYDAAGNLRFRRGSTADEYILFSEKAAYVRNKVNIPGVGGGTTSTSPYAWTSYLKEATYFTALANDLTFSVDANVTIAPENFQKHIIRITASGAERVITFTGGSSKAFRDASNGLLTVSGANWTYNIPDGVTAYFSLIYNNDADRWDIVDVVLTGTAIADNGTLTDGAGVVIDPDLGSVLKWTLAANRTPDLTAIAEGQTVTLFIDNGGSYDVTWSSVTVTWQTDSGSPPTLKNSGYTTVVLSKQFGTLFGWRAGDGG